MTGTPNLLSPDVCEQIFHAALAAGDTRGVEAALTVMAPQDPHRAQRLLDLTKTALVVAKAAHAATPPTAPTP